MLCSIRSILLVLLISYQSAGQIVLPSTFKKISSIEGNLGDLPNAGLFGTSITTIGDLNGDGFTDIAVGSRDDGGTYVGAVRVLFLDGSNNVKSLVKLTSLGTPTSVFGYSVRGLGDLNKDGTNDLAVGALYDGDGGYQYGAVWILFLNSDATVKDSQKISTLAGGFTETLTTLSSFGSSIANLGDLDGDGNTDIAVGAYRDNGSDFKTGAIYILFLNSNGTVKKSTKISGGMGGLNASLKYEDYFGSCVSAIQDLDGDGIVDIVVGAHRADDGNTDAGCIWVLFMNTDGTVKHFQKISSLEGNFNVNLLYENFFGSSLLDVGDLDGDGVNDLAVGSSDNIGGVKRGAVWFLNLTQNGEVKNFAKISHNSGGTNLTLDAGDSFGVSMASLGDVNEDSILDIAIGAIRDDDGGTDRGAIWITGNNCAIVTASAGNDTVLCDGITQTVLNAQNTGFASGQWSVLYGTGSFQNDHDPKSGVYDLADGINSFIWTVTGGLGCSTKIDTVNIVVYEAPSQAFAGADQLLCSQIQTLLNATPVNSGSGRWIIGGDGTAVVLNPDTPTSAVQGLSYGTNILVWETYSSDQCPSLRDSVIIQVYSPPSTAFAGEDITLCNERVTVLNAAKPEAGNGKWEVVTGNVIIDKIDDPRTGVEILTDDEIVLRWTVEAPVCPSNSDDLIVKSYSFNEDDFYNVITPDNNDVNDYWVVNNIDLLPGEKNLIIINRWGKTVFETSNYKNNWNARDLNDGIYFYHLNLTACHREVKGWISVIK